MKENNELVKRTQVEGTPFVIVTTPDGGSVVTLGKYRVSEPFETELGAIDYVGSKDWNLILSVAMLIAEEEIAKYDKLTDTIRKQQKQKRDGTNKQKEN